MNRAEFEQLVIEGFEQIPQEFREKMDNVALLVEDEPSMEVRKKEGLRGGKTLLGYYHGVPLAARGWGYGMGNTMPDTITIYQKPIEQHAGGNPETIRRVVAQTVWHEYAHHFGLDEDAVRKAEKRRGHVR